MKKWLAVLLVLAMVLGMVACGAKEPTGKGEEVSFTFVVVDPDGVSTTFEITTEEETVGAALIAEGLIEGEEGPYGLYVKTVNGVTVTYEEDGKYWAFYEGDVYASAGVELTPIEPGATYSFRVE